MTMKEIWKPGTLIYPLPAVLVSCGATPEEYNLLTVAWTGTVCTSPPMCYVSVRPERHSYEIIRRTGEFVINLTTRDLARATDWCGVRSGRDYDKFREMGLTPAPGIEVAAPIVEEAPVSIECRVRQIVPLGSHDMFLAEVVAVQVDAAWIDPATGRFCLERACPIVYSHGEYFALGEAIGHFGWSVRKRPAREVSEPSGKPSLKPVGDAADTELSDGMAKSGLPSVRRNNFSGRSSKAFGKTGSPKYGRKATQKRSASSRKK